MGAFYNDGIDDAADKNTLSYYAELCGKHVGVALCTYKGYQSDRDESGRQFNMMVAENEMKMDALQPSQGQFSFGSADQLVSFAQKNNMAVRGHCLVWHMQQPTWLSSDGKKNDKGWTRQQALDLMKRHITTVMTHYRGKVTEWDVVNECLDDDQAIVRTNPEGYKLRPTVWQLAIGDDYIDSAFVYARQADPDAVLYLNDYDVEQQGKAKTTAFYNLAMHLRKQNIPIDGVGLQCHFSVGDVDSVKLDQNIRHFGDAGLKCAITELDMGIASTSADDLQEQARNYRVVTDVVLNNDNCQNMVIWGIKDNDSWRQASSPLLYTAGLDRKPAWYAVRSALRHRVLSDTGIHDVQRDAPADDRYYDLHGRRVSASQLRPGIYIHSGRKVLVK
jgi:GH35 family endo-1,4-beta-xylanase